MEGDVDDAFWARVGEFSARIVVMDTIVVHPTPGLDPVWSSFQVLYRPHFSFFTSISFIYIYFICCRVQRVR